MKREISFIDLEEIINTKSETEKLLVEFDVEKTISREYQYEEKLLRFRGNNTRYKAIVKDGTLVAIIGRNYKLIPNEKVKKILKSLAAKYNLNLKVIEPPWRLYAILSKGDMGVLISNSVDGTIALRADACLKLKGWAILVGSKVKTLYKKHSRKLTILDLDKEIITILAVAKKYRQWIEKLKDLKLADHVEPFKALAESMPKVYTDGILSYRFFNPDLNMKQVYETISTRIWSRETDMRTKITLFKKLNDIFMGIGVILTI